MTQHDRAVAITADFLDRIRRAETERTHQRAWLSAGEPRKANACRLAAERHIEAARDEVRDLEALVADMGLEVTR